MSLDHKNWQYTTFLATENPENPITPKGANAESLSVEWVKIEEVEKLPLLDAFGRQWGNIKNKFESLN
jgi:hypothetical protein